MSAPASHIPPAGTELVRLAGNEPTWPPPATVLAAARDAVTELHRYPEMHSEQLVTRLARHHQVDPDHVVVGAGASGLLREILLAVCVPRAAREVIFAAPGFDLYDSLPGQLGAVPVPVPLTLDGRQDLDEMGSRVSRQHTAAVLVCNPHNPTGSAVRRDELNRFLDSIPERVSVVLDEAYRAYVADPAVPTGLRLNELDDSVEATRPNVVVLRSFSKSHSLGGARVGYLIAAPRIAAAVRERVMPFSVNRVAQAAALAAMDAEEAGAYTAAWDAVIRERTELRAALLAAGYEVRESHANYLWLRLTSRSTEFTDHCARHGIAIRDYPLHGGVRVSVGTPAANRAFLAAARDFLR